jgi:hypothetical protein
MKSILPFGYFGALSAALLSCGQQRGAESSDTSARVAQTGRPSRCNVQGVWSLDSSIVDGKAESLSQVGHKQMKIIGAGHYAWVSQGSGPTRLKTTADSLAAYRALGSGAGTYRVTDSTYVEHLDLFSDPQHIGREVEITCRVTGNRWDHSFDWPSVENGTPRTLHIQEIWRRVE